VCRLSVQGGYSSHLEHLFDTLNMSTMDQLLYSALHGTAMRYAAEHRKLDGARGKSHDPLRWNIEPSGTPPDLLEGK
jgi:hypothetical protein